MKAKVINLKSHGKRSEKSLLRQRIDESGLIIEKVLPTLLNDLVVMTGKPIRLIFNPDTPTASTDCVAEINISPNLFTKDLVEIGFGSAYHEAGHIISGDGMNILKAAHREGGEFLQNIMNIILDRRDDCRSAKQAVGFADTLRGRPPIYRRWGVEKR